MNRVKYIVVLITLFLLQQQFASEVVRIQPEEFWGTDNFIELSIDHPAIKYSQTIQHFIFNLGQIEVEIPFSEEGFMRYEYFMAQDIFDAEEFEALSLGDILTFMRMLDFFEVNDQRLGIILDEVMPIITELVDNYLVKKYSNYFKNEGKSYRDFKIEKDELNFFLDGKFSYRYNLFTEKFKNYFFEFYANNMEGLKESSVWKWIIKNYYFNVARISFTQLQNYFPDEYVVLVRNNLDKKSRHFYNFHILSFKDFPFTFYFEKNFEKVAGLAVIKYEGSFGKNIIFSIEDHLNSLFLSPKTIENIEYLDLKELELNLLPSSINHLKSLKKLTLNGNNDLETLPESIRDLHNLEFLGLKIRNIQHLPESLVELPNLKKIEFLEKSLPYYETKDFMRLEEALQLKGVDMHFFRERHKN